MPTQAAQNSPGMVSRWAARVPSTRRAGTSYRTAPNGLGRCGGRGFTWNCDSARGGICGDSTTSGSVPPVAPMTARGVSAARASSASGSSAVGWAVGRGPARASPRVLARAPGGSGTRLCLVLAGLVLAALAPAGPAPAAPAPAALVLVGLAPAGLVLAWLVLSGSYRPARPGPARPGRFLPPGSSWPVRPGRPVLAGLVLSGSSRPARPGQARAVPRARLVPSRTRWRHATERAGPLRGCAVPREPTVVPTTSVLCLASVRPGLGRCAPAGDVSRGTSCRERFPIRSRSGSAMTVPIDHRRSPPPALIPQRDVPGQTQPSRTCLTTSARRDRQYPRMCSHVTALTGGRIVHAWLAVVRSLSESDATRNGSPLADGSEPGR